MGANLYLFHTPKGTEAQKEAERSGDAHRCREARVLPKLVVKASRELAGEQANYQGHGEREHAVVYRGVILREVIRCHGLSNIIAICLVSLCRHRPQGKAGWPAYPSHVNDVKSGGDAVQHHLRAVNQQEQGCSSYQRKHGAPRVHCKSYTSGTIGVCAQTQTYPTVLNSKSLYPAATAPMIIRDSDQTTCAHNRQAQEA